MKQELIQTKELIKGVSCSVELDDKVKEFMSFYKGYLKRNGASEEELFNKPKKLRNLIEKIAIYYEFRYSNIEVLDFIKNFCYNNTSIIKTDLSLVLESLGEEDDLFIEPRYDKVIYIEPESKTGKITLNGTGEIISIEDMNYDGWLDIYNEFYKDYTLERFNEELDKKYLDIPLNNGLRESLNDYKNRKYIYDNLYNCIMYRIIENGGKGFGPKRAFIFALDFNKDADIPVRYGFDRDDENMKDFFGAYNRVGNPGTLECYEGYFDRTRSSECLNTVMLVECMKDSKEIKLNDEKVKVQEEVIGNQKVLDRPVII